MNLTTLQAPHVSGIVQSLSFCVWFLSLSKMSSRFMCLFFVSFLFKVEWYSFVYVSPFCLSICLLRDTWVNSTFWLLWMTLLWTWVYKHSFKNLLPIPPCIHEDVELLGHVVILLVVSWWSTAPFSVVALPAHIPSTVYKDDKQLRLRKLAPDKNPEFTKYFCMYCITRSFKHNWLAGSPDLLASIQILNNRSTLFLHLQINVF